jgi:hypothetical protein
VESWRELSPDRFPAPPDWRVVSEWQSAQELAAIEHLATLRLEREATVARLSQQEDQAETERKLASEVADASLRRLLTDQGPTLVNEVLETLIELGFAPQDMDSVHPAGDRREDLRITTPDDPTWEAIAEVRGYQAGAKVNDFLRLSRFAVRYAAEKQRSPSAIWYIANIFIRQSPSERPPMLDSSNDEVEEFSNAGGLVVDTRDLFRLRRAVQDGHLDKVAARRLLTAKTGRFKYP